MTKIRLIEILESVLSWGSDHDKEFRECLVKALGITEEEYKEVFHEELDTYLGKEDEDLDLPTEDEIGRPSNLETDDDFEEYISNYLSDEYGFCVNSFKFDFDTKKIYIYDIDWDTTE